MLNFSAHDSRFSLKRFHSQKRGMTLIELLIVIAMIGAITFPLLLTYRTYRTSQALSASVEAVANHTRSVHIFSREAQKQREWGIKNIDDRVYALYSSGASGQIEEQKYILDSGVAFEEDFDILFRIGTGTADHDTTIKIVNINGKKAWINVSKNGVVEINPTP